MKTIHIPTLSGSALKTIALCAMILDHTATILHEGDPAFAEPLFHAGGVPVSAALILNAAGRLAFPLFAFLLVEGYRHTSSRHKYALRLAAFAFISEVPWDLAWNGTPLFGTQNVMFTLLLGFAGITVLEEYRERPLIRCAGVFIILVLSWALRTDFGAPGCAFIMLLHLLRGAPLPGALLSAAVLPAGALAATAFIPAALYDGTRGFIRTTPLKYLFYAVYPAHLLVIWLLRFQPFAN